MSKRTDAKVRKALADNRDAAADALREELVQIGKVALKHAKLPAGYNAVIVVTDDQGTWCAVSSSDDRYTHRLLNAALNGADLRLHAREYRSEKEPSCG